MQWCIDNKFFKVEEGLWSGPWYYDKKRQANTVEHEVDSIKNELPGSTANIMMRTQHYNCAECNKAFQTFYLAHVHMKKCCPHKLNLQVCSKNFGVDRGWYECSLCRYPRQEFRNEEECLRHIATACPSYPRFSSCPPDTFVMPKPRTRFPCTNCGKEHAKWNKCLEHMWICCPDVVLAQDGELEISRKVSSMRLNPHAVEFKSVFHDHYKRIRLSANNRQNLQRKGF